MIYKNDVTRTGHSAVHLAMPFLFGSLSFCSKPTFLPSLLSGALIALVTFVLVASAMLSAHPIDSSISQTL